MYKKSVQGWLKHLDFIILDVICLWISFTMAFGIRHRNLEILTNSLYRDMIWSIALLDIVVIFFFDSYKNVLKRGFYQEFTMTLKHDILLTLSSVFYSDFPNMFTKMRLVIQMKLTRYQKLFGERKFSGCPFDSILISI